MGRHLDDLRATGLYHCLAVDGLKVATIAAAVLAIALFAGLGRLVAEVAALAAVAAYALAVGLHPSAVRAAFAAGLGSLAWLAGRERDRWQAPLVGAAVLLGWNLYFAARRGVPAVVRCGRLTRRRHAARCSRPRGLPGLPCGRAADWRFDRMRPRDRAGHVAAVPPNLPRHRPGERRCSSRGRRGAQPGARDRGRSCRQSIPPVARALAHGSTAGGAWLRRRLRACVRERPGCPDHIAPRGRRAGPERGRGGRLCLATWRARAS